MSAQTTIIGYVLGGRSKPAMICDRDNRMPSFMVRPLNSLRDDKGNYVDEPYSVLLPGDPKWHKVWHHLAGGRIVQVTGELFHRPNGRLGNDGQMKFYANPTIRAGSRGVTLVDSPHHLAAARQFNLASELGFLDEETAKNLASKFQDHYDESNWLQPGENPSDAPGKIEPPRVVINRTRDNPPPAQTNTAPQGPDSDNGNEEPPF